MPYNNDRLSARFITMRNVQTAATTGSATRSHLGTDKATSSNACIKATFSAAWRPLPKTLSGTRPRRTTTKTSVSNKPKEAKMIAQILKTRAPLLYQSQQILSYQHCHKRIDGKQINAPLTLGDAVEDKDYQNDQPREQLYRRLVAESTPALLQPQQQGIPFRQATHVFHFKPNKETTRTNVQGIHPQIKVRKLYHIGFHGTRRTFLPINRPVFSSRTKSRNGCPPCL